MQKIELHASNFRVSREREAMSMKKAVSNIEKTYKIIRERKRKQEFKKENEVKKLMYTIDRSSSLHRHLKSNQIESHID